ncbi:oligopeptide/dipeptide ABC transporter ATP-binding protein [Aeromicrobium sp.]|uniref:ABC transporter ATP-binding protein n=1 Tax=Aeromicrobium sp. TaxID=1871063 RepID=UPI0028AAD0B3|nr:oligopeptide/dipeptide ABC transporter ATP-binding protein [Aeromicrobium sp.]
MTVDQITVGPPATPVPAFMEIDDVSVHYPTRGKDRRPWQALRNVSLSIERGTTLGLVGESGSGKTTLGQAILRRVELAGGSLTFDGQDISGVSGKQLRMLRRRMQVVFQNPVGSLNPRMTILENVAEPLVAQGIARRARDVQDQVAELMDSVGLRRDMMYRYPHQFSGGQCQRVGIARALALEPEFIVADEPVSSLDVSVQAQIVNLLDNLRRERGGTMLFIAHDLAVVKHTADKVATMYAGEIVELGVPSQMYEHPQHPYTDALLSAIPSPEYPRRRDDAVRLQGGGAPDLREPPPGCVFARRCPFVQERCLVERPLLRPTAAGQMAACHFSEELDLQGVRRQNTEQV